MRINSIPTYNNDYKTFKNLTMKGNLTPRKCIASSMVVEPLLSMKAAMIFIAALSGILGLAEFVEPLLQKIHSKPVKLAPQIEYKEAQTLDEAKKFAKKNFKIKRFVVDDLSVANLINEALTNISNKFKGDVYMPRKIKYAQFDNVLTGGDYDLTLDRLRLNKFSQVDLDYNFDFNKRCLYNGALRQYPIATNIESLNHEIDNSDKLCPVAKWAVNHDISRLYQVSTSLPISVIKSSKIVHDSGRDQFGPLCTGKFGTIYHEIAHVFDFKSSKKSEKEYDAKKQIFNEGKKELVLPKYANSDYSEFIAEVFAGYMNGAKYPESLLKLFNSLTKIRLPQD